MTEAVKEITRFTPPMRVLHPHFEEPDTYKDKTEYKGRLRGDASEPKIAAFLKQQIADAKALGFAKVTSATNLPMKKLTDEEGDPTGEVQIIIKSKFKPIIVGPNGKPMKNPPKIGTGSLIAAKLTLKAYEKGVAAYLEAIQLLEAVSGGGGGDASGFGDVSGEYVVDEGESLMPAIDEDETEETSEGDGGGLDI